MVANVPQGLPSTVTAQLFIVAERMGAHNVFVKKLDVIETLGSCSMICTDKTGTLTQNLMTVVNLWTPKESLTAGLLPPSFSLFGLETEIDYVLVFVADAARQALSKCTDESNCSLRLLVAGMSLNSRVVHETKDGEMALKGDATELGIHRYCSSALSTFASDHTNLESYRAANEKIHEIPFNSSNKWQLSIHCVSEGFSSIAPAGAKQVLLLKGAPDVLMSKCSQYVDPHGQVVAIEDSFMSSYLKAYEDFGGCGERVLGFAVRFLPFTIVEEEKSNSAFLEDLKSSYTKTGEETRSDLTFVGLATLMDPARKEVPAAIADCHTAGIKVVMVTGDHPITAEAIARNIGLMHHPTKAMMSRTSGIPEDQIEESTVKAAVIHGNQIPGLSEEYWRELANKPEIVFARTSPEQKLLIVQKFTAAGNVVAMTGDGVNDSPALKQAAIGIAMGMNGSDVAREAADVVLLDDNFASIVIGVREGRLLFANLRKSITYTLSHLLPEVLPVLMWAFTGFPQTINSILILFIDLWTELAPASSLAFEKAEDNIMNVPPRNPKTDKLVDGTVMLQSYALIGVLEVGVCYLIFYMVLQQYGLEMRDFARSNDEYFTVSVDRDYTSYDGDIFSANEQKHILSVIQATWYLSIVMCQAINIWCCKSRTESIFSLSIFDNRYVNFGVTLALILGIVAVYVPGFQYITASSNPPSLIMLYGALVAIAALVGLTELQKWSIRSYPDMTHVVSIIFMTLLTAAVLIVAFLN